MVAQLGYSLGNRRLSELLPPTFSQPHSRRVGQRYNKTQHPRGVLGIGCHISRPHEGVVGLTTLRGVAYVQPHLVCSFEGRVGSSRRNLAR